MTFGGKRGKLPKAICGFVPVPGACQGWRTPMVDLDNLEVLQVDRSGMLDLLLGLPAQLQTGERLGHSADHGGCAGQPG